MPSSEKAVPVGQLSSLKIDVGPEPSMRNQEGEDAAVQGCCLGRSHPQKRLGNMFFERHRRTTQKSMPDGRMAVLEYYRGRRDLFFF
jgi:hypothetical protein